MSETRGALVTGGLGALMVLCCVAAPAVVGGAAIGAGRGL